MLRTFVTLASAVVALMGSAAAASAPVPSVEAFVWAPSNEIVVSTSSGIYVVSPNGGSPRLLTRKHSESGLGLDVSPDGKTLVFSGENAAEDWSLFTIPLAGGTLRPLGLLGFAPVWSPDGRQIAYAGGGGDYIADADGRHAHVVVPTGDPDLTGGPTWSPDGKKLAYVGCRTPPRSLRCPDYPSDNYLVELYVTDVDGSNRHRLTDGIGSAGCPTWSRRALLAYYTVNKAHVVRKGPVQTFESKSCPRWDPDGRRLALTTHDALVITRYDGTGRKRIDALTGNWSYQDVAWSPDGSKLAFSAGRQSVRQNRLYVVGADGRGLRRLL